MNDRQSRKFNMATTTQTLLDENAALIAGKPLVEDAKTALTDELDDIDQHRQQQTIVTTGTTGQKDLAQQKAATQGAAISGGIAAIALNAGDLDTAAEYDIEESQLNVNNDGQALNLMKKIKDKMVLMSAALIAAGYIAAIQTAYTNAVADFEGLIGKPDTKIATKSGFTAALKTDFNQLDAILLILDKAMKIFLLNGNEIFYNQYLNARKIDDTGVRHISIRGLLKDKETGALLAKLGTLTLQPGGTITKTGTTAKFSYFSLNAAPYAVTASYPNYPDKTVTGIVVNPTGITDIIIEMEK